MARKARPISRVVELLLMAASSNADEPLSSPITDAQHTLDFDDAEWILALHFRGRVEDAARDSGVEVPDVWDMVPLALRIAILTDAAILADAEGA